MGFLATFTSTAGIITTPLSGKIADLFQSHGVVFFSFGVVALAGSILTLFIKEVSANTPNPPEADHSDLRFEVI
jgi:nitrate/nitrite transporter NarK